MKLLTDTHTFLWFVYNDPQLSSTARNLIADPANDILLSLASVWELAIKYGIGKLTLTQPVELFVPDQLQRNNMQTLPILMSHALYVAKLPLHHRDPFDRLMIAQSLLEAIPIISVDAVFDNYGVQRFW